MKKLWIILLPFALLLAACGGEPGGTSPPATRASRTSALPTPIPIIPTPTPLPPPPTPTPLPTNTSAPEGAEATPAPAVSDIMVEILAGPFTMGTDSGDPNEAPAHEVDLPAFMIDKFEVTNADFAVFVEATGYETYAAKQGTISTKPILAAIIRIPNTALTCVDFGVAVGLTMRSRCALPIGTLATRPPPPMTTLVSVVRDSRWLVARFA